ncbi:beta-galactosidase [Mucilaginibacter sp. OK268]|uniref:sugar-binding domain-containing protein n=1 Tax=Mucilaginibacter sp. OK268 TaxID=1881048 RepID=UPI00087E8A56|nr:sugar-binding domain-containing protein [Mucilaginibacter sp. OK268]SDP99762.1 beta-galactosidase [Mucilaginibacter sp. OK268]
MKSIQFFFILLALLLSVGITRAQDSGEISFDNNWRFRKDTLNGAQNPEFNDSGWRILNLPHDWSIEDLPNQKEGEVQGPFTKTSVGKAATGFTEGGTGWYRKTFTLNNNYKGKKTYILFDGVYMDADVWINGHHLGNHPYGYTSFYYDLTNYLTTNGKSNVIAVRVKNLGKNSRWYSGSGIYRHVWLLAVNPIHTKLWGNYITTPEVLKDKATVKVQTSIENKSLKQKTVIVKLDLLNPSGQVVASRKMPLTVPADSSADLTQKLIVIDPKLWGLDNPVLYKARVTLTADNKTIDQTITPFGIRSLQFDGQKGILLNGQVIKLKGGCIHHDLGPLGAASFDRAEERKIELIKNAGYNSIRLSHNPASSALLNACDRLGILILDEAFDMWELPKNAQDYHLYFKDWSQKDLASMVLRDRNHPSVMMWSIGNEIYEAPDSSGIQNAKRLSNEVRRLDPTRPVTDAIVFLPPYTKKPWKDYEAHVANLDIDGYNYFLDPSIYFQRDSATLHRFETERAKHPNKLYMSTEYLPNAALENWNATEKYPWFLGGFCWTAMDYIGEAGIGKSILVPESQKLSKGLMGMGLFYRNNWPIFNAYCGDLDLIGDRKAESYYKNVVWRNSPIELLVHRPIPEGQKEVIATWGMSDEIKSWTWPGQEGKKMQVDVYTRSKTVKLELNGKVIAEQTVPEGSITATFQVEYEPGTLAAKSYDNGKETGSSVLSTTGKPTAIRLIADRKIIKSNQNDLSFISVQIVDSKGNVVPSVDDTEINFKLSGNATIAAVGNGNPSDMSSFQQPHKKAYQGRAQVILKSSSKRGLATLTASAPGLKENTIQMQIN